MLGVAAGSKSSEKICYNTSHECKSDELSGRRKFGDPNLIVSRSAPVSSPGLPGIFPSLHR